MKINLNNLILPYINSQNPVNVNKFQNTKLTPLSKDTVSFTGGGNVFHSEDMHIAPNERLCNSACINAEVPERYLKHVLDNWLGSISKKKFNVTKSKQMPVISYYTGTKSAQSTREKVVSKFSKIVRDEQNEFSMDLAKELFSHFKFANRTNVKSLYYEISGIVESNQDKNHKFPPYKNVQYYLNSVLNKFIQTGKFNLEGISDEKFQEIKKEISTNLASKQRPDKEIHYYKNLYINPATMEGIKHYANDLVRGRIVLNLADSNNVQDVLDALKNAASRGELKVTSVENYVPDVNKIPAGKRVSDYEYIKSSKVKDFANGINAEYYEKPSRMGYMGIHVNLDLSNTNITKQGREFKGFSGEIQIVGKDVLKLKDVEDLCYKIKDNKSSFDEKYKRFEDYFLRHYSNCDKQEFDDYTYALYLSQRELAPGTSSRAKFKSPKELGFSNIPTELDFTALANLKEDCEKSYEAKLKI